MKSDLRKNPTRSLGRYWLTLADSTAFTLVNTAITVADELRQALAGQAGVPARGNSAELAVVLLTAAEAGWGRGQAAQLVSRLVRMDGAAQAVRGRICQLVREALQKLPSVLWTEDGLRHREALLDELAEQMRHFQVYMISQPTREELREREWRDALAGMRKGDAPQ